MNATLSRTVVVFVGVILWGSMVAAQSDCPTIVQNALEIADTACEGIGRNQACYGNVALSAVPQEGVSDFTFSAAGDMVDVTDVQSLTLSSLDVDAEQWGIAEMKIQANIPDTLPGQNVTFLLFGDVKIENAPAPPDERQPVSPMQAFLFKSGFQDRPCDAAPDSGILIQSPEGAGTINLTANGVDITLGSTIYLQAQPSGDMTLSVLEGHATASAFGRTVTVPAGTWVRIPMDADLAATDVPSDPEPYDPSRIAGLPLLILPDEIISASPLPDDDITALNAPPEGFWMLTYDSEYIDVGCAADAYNGGYATELRYDADGAILWSSITLYPVGYGVYESLPNPGATTPHIYRMTVTSPTQIEGVNTWIVPDCATIVNNFHLVLESAF